MDKRRGKGYESIRISKDRNGGMIGQISLDDIMAIDPVHASIMMAIGNMLHEEEKKMSANKEEKTCGNCIGSCKTCSSHGHKQSDINTNGMTPDQAAFMKSMVQLIDFMNAGNERPDMLLRINDIIDFRVHSDGITMPNRCKIINVKFNEEGHTWDYYVEVESTRQKIYIQQDWLVKHMSKKKAPVYNLPVIGKRFNDGWRFVGNFKLSDVGKMLTRVQVRQYVKDARITEAYYPDGKLASGHLAIWMKYDHPIQA